MTLLGGDRAANGVKCLLLSRRSTNAESSSGPDALSAVLQTCFFTLCTQQKEPGALESIFHPFHKY